MCRLDPALDVEEKPEGYRPTILLVSFLACFALHASTAAGQTVGAMTGAINGTVTDSTSAALPRVTIVISSAALMGTRTAVTNGEGLYRFPALAPGEYTLVFTLNGFKAVRREGIYVGLGFTATVDVELQIATLQENVIVERNSPVIDKQSTAIGTTFDARQLADLPSARSMWAIQAATPAVYVARFDVSANATGRRRRFQRLRNGWFQSADGRRHQRDRHQPDGLYPRLRRVRRGLGWHGRARPGVAMRRVCTCSSSASREETTIAARSMRTSRTETGSRSTSTRSRSAVARRAAAGCRRAMPTACGATTTSTPMSAASSNPTRLWWYLLGSRAGGLGAAGEFPGRAASDVLGELQRQGHLPDHPTQQARSRSGRRVGTISRTAWILSARPASASVRRPRSTSRKSPPPSSSPGDGSGKGEWNSVDQ